ncbi:putative heat shock factor binding protein [Elsinoe australis]|uniref:Putative heat shock factor binding protein n=1 Tax=Elsinoe australis TaxID=40998 RepID=A0A4V6DUK0_9PEZI|nr:putative heat shock factor binding protein [Elsinoe australis]
MPSDSPDHNGDAADAAPAELTAVVEDLLNQLTTKFSTISSEMIAKMDDMSKRLDNLEAIIQQSNSQSTTDDSKPAT